MNVAEPSPNVADLPPIGAEEIVAAPPKRRWPRIDRSSFGLGVLVALAGGGLWHMHVRTAPSLAAATPSEAEAKVAAFLSGGPADIARLRTSMAKTREVADAFANPTTLASVSAGPAADPFAFEPTQAAKPQAAQPDHSGLTREQARQRGAEAARKLRVGSVMVGAGRTPACTINGKLCVEGEAVEEFTVERITQASVLLRSGEFRYELRLRK